MPTKAKPFANIYTSSTFHWAQRVSKGYTSDVIHSKYARITAENIEEAAALSLLIDILQDSPNAPKGLRDQFSKEAQRRVKEFAKDNPNFKFVKGGRKLGSPNKTPEEPVPTPKMRKPAVKA